MTVDLPEGLRPFQLGHLLGSVTVAGAVEAVAANAITLIPIVRHRVELAPQGHCAVKGGFEAPHQRHVGRYPAKLPDSSHIGGVVGWRQRIITNHAFDYVVVESHDPGDAAGMNRFETNGAQLVQRWQSGSIFRQTLQRFIDSVLVAGQRALALDLGTDAELIDMPGGGIADPLHATVCQHHTGWHIEQFVFERRAAQIGD